MTDLISRLSAATGPSRELDAEIALANGWTHERLGASPEWGWWEPRPDGKRWLHPLPPRYTESIDAAMTLVPEGWGVEVRRYRDGTSFAKIYCDEKGATELGATPAIAFVIACLSSRVAQRGTSAGHLRPGVAGSNPAAAAIAKEDSNP